MVETQEGGKTERPIRVLFVIGTLQVGGAEGQLVNLVTRLDRGRFEPAVLCLSAEGPFRATLDAAGIQVENAAFSGFWGFRRNPRRILQVLREISKFIGFMRAFRPDIVHGFLFWAYVYGAFAARLARVPIVVTSRLSLGNFKESRRGHLFIEQIANRLTDLVVANSEAVRQDAIAQENLPRDKVIVIYNRVDTNRYSGQPDENLRRELELVGSGPIVGVVATFRRLKGHQYFFEAWAKIIGEFPKAVALMVGDGPTRGEMEKQVQSMGIGGSIRFLGTRHDIPSLLALMDLVVHPSLEEGFSNAILEAMAAGRPVVATKVGGNPEAVVHGVTGFLVPSRDSHALALAISELLEHPEEAAAYGNAGRARVVQYFDLELMVKEQEALYQRLMRGLR